VNTTHLAVLELRLSHERAALGNAKSDKERALRSVWVRQIEKEITEEIKFLNKQTEQTPNLTDDELLRALES
jgi:hypothetical protein